MSDTRDDLLDATGHVLAQEGYAGLTTQKVATEAGVSHPTVHYHFDTKEQLLSAYVKEFTNDWLTHLGSIEGDDAGYRLATILSVFTTGFADSDQANHTRALIELHTRAPYVEPLREALTELDNRTIEFFAALIETGINEGVFDDVSSQSMAQLILCTVDGVVLRQNTLNDTVTSVLTNSLCRHVLTDLYIGDVPNLGDEL